jgi:UDP-N-acetylmuramyl pentapeptide phosphotransferase/UDP-N-acetylglucosamine-1-phosphate transferase
LTAVFIAVAVLLAAFAAWLGAQALASGWAHEPMALDDTWGGPRKVHVFSTPRIGGIAIAAGLAIGFGVEWALNWALWPWWLLLACATPAFACGLVEDFTGRGTIMMRLAFTALAAALAFFFLDARIALLDVPLLDDLLGMHVVSFAFTVFAVTGVAHSMNVIDGLNGLSGVTALLAAIGLAIVAAAVGDSFVLPAACVLAGSIAGFLLVNYPRGRIFLGDGGAYLVGLLLAELAVILVHRNSEVSPWFPLVLLAYPVWETLFSMFRRKVRGRSTGEADALHLHTLFYRRVVRWRSFRGSPRDYVTRNSVASLLLWAIPVLCLALALAFWASSGVLQLAAAAFAIVYTVAYRRLARFGVPGWLVIRAAGAPQPKMKSLPFEESSNRTV